MTEWSAGLIRSVSPRAGVDGGEVKIACEGYDTSDYAACRVLFGGQAGRLISASPSRVIAAVPESEVGAEGAEVALESGSGTLRAPFTLGVKLADDLHPVANPVVDPDDGSIFVTRSGTRGQKLPVTIFKVSLDEGGRPIVSAYINDEIVNPTGMALSREGTLFVTSRYDGTLYRISPFKEVQTVASDLGTATGVAFDNKGYIYVGDRGGTIFRVNEIGESRPFASLEASVSAYHLAFGPDGDLYVTGPTVSAYDSVYRINAMGDVSVFYRGLGRPQGLAFDQAGNLYVAASLRGHRGIVRIPPGGETAEVVLSGAALVGLAFDDAGNMIVAGTQCLYRAAMGIRGYSVA